DVAGQGDGRRFGVPDVGGDRRRVGDRLVGACRTVGGGGGVGGQRRVRRVVHQVVDQVAVDADDVDVDAAGAGRQERVVGDDAAQPEQLDRVTVAGHERVPGDDHVGDRGDGDAAQGVQTRRDRHVDRVADDRGTRSEENTP